jgi:hypothetical protein
MDVLILANLQFINSKSKKVSCGANSNGKHTKASLHLAFRVQNLTFLLFEQNYGI